jgi:hypothetical protein
MNQYETIKNAIAAIDDTLRNTPYMSQKVKAEFLETKKNLKKLLRFL